MAEPEFRDGPWWFPQPDGTMLRWDPAANAWVGVVGRTTRRQEERARRVAAATAPATATA
jgi:hypothetical protein